MGKQGEPVFVNLQRSMVQVYDENRRPVRVAPWTKRNRGQPGTFEVRGEHYRQFTRSGKGPLFPRPAGAESAAPAPSADAAASKKNLPGDETSPPADGGKKTKEPKVPAAPEDLKSYFVDGAAALVAETEDAAVLKAWAWADDRKGVKDAIEKRLAELAE